MKKSVKVDSVNTDRREGGNGSEFLAVVRAFGGPIRKLEFNATSEIAKALAADGIHTKLVVTIEIAENESDGDDESDDEYDDDEY